jgi:hypothetical protein
LPQPQPPAWLPPGFWNPNLTTPTPFDPAQHCVDAINQDRATLRLAPLARWVVAEQCTSSEAQSAAQTGQPHGQFGHCSEMAQNVCPGWAGPADKMIGPCIASEWQEGPGADYAAHGHYLNMSSTRYSRVACGFYTAPNGSVWAVQNFQ